MRDCACRDADGDAGEQAASAFALGDRRGRSLIHGEKAEGRRDEQYRVYA